MCLDDWDAGQTTFTLSLLSSESRGSSMLEIRVPDSLSCVHNDVQNLRGLITGWFFVEKYSFCYSLGFLKILSFSWKLFILEVK